MRVNKTNLKPLACGLLAALAAMAAVAPANAQQSTRSEQQVRERQNFEVIVGDFYTGRSPYFKSSGEPAPVVAQVKPAPVPAPVANCSVINSGLVHMTKTMPAEATLGEPFTYELKPMAVGCAGNVVVTDQIPDGCSLVSTEPHLELAPTQQRDQAGNRLWELALWRGKELLKTWPSVSGRPETELQDRFNRPGNRAPLPPGAYAVGLPLRLNNSDHYEIGRSWFIPINPLFQTPRSHFGIHQDVSHDGTDGCIGLASRPLTEEVADWVRSVGARYLWVRS